MKTRKEMLEAFNKFLKIHNAYEAYYRNLSVSIHYLPYDELILTAFMWTDDFEYWNDLDTQWLRFLKSINSK